MCAYRDTRDEIVKTLIMGLVTDGVHHKQWALEAALRTLCEERYVDDAKREFEWEPGIAP